MEIIGFTGGKGGTGKSTVATAFAYGLAKNNKVLLVDADVDCPNDHLLLSIERNFFKMWTYFNKEKPIFKRKEIAIERSRKNYGSHLLLIDNSVFKDKPFVEPDNFRE